MPAQVEGLSVLTEGKTRLLLYDFHAVRYPLAAVHHRSNIINDDGMFDLPLPAGRQPVPERILTERSVSTRDKSKVILDHLAHVFRYYTSRSSSERPHAFLVKEADQHWRAHQEIAQDLVDARGEAMTPAQILPDEFVVDAMFASLNHGYVKRCPALETFIDGVAVIHGTSNGN